MKFNLPLLSFSESSQKQIALEVIKNRKDIWKAVQEAKENNTVLGVYCAAFGEGMFLTGIDDFFKIENEEVILFKPYDLHGAMLQRTQIALAEIKSVTPFSYNYRNPLFKISSDVA